MIVLVYSALTRLLMRWIVFLNFLVLFSSSSMKYLITDFCPFFYSVVCLFVCFMSVLLIYDFCKFFFKFTTYMSSSLDALDCSCFAQNNQI